MDMKKFKVINLKNSPAANLLERIRDEAHRFARRYHNKMLKNDMIKEGQKKNS